MSDMPATPRKSPRRAEPILPPARINGAAVGRRPEPDAFFLRPKPDRRARPRVAATEIARRAYELYEARGSHGHDLEDWLRAERELNAVTPDPSISA